MEKSLAAKARNAKGAKKISPRMSERAEAGAKEPPPSSSPALRGRKEVGVAFALVVKNLAIVDLQMGGA
jgi:hypothetical protein